jgi:RNase P subunit RPR2
VPKLGRLEAREIGEKKMNHKICGNCGHLLKSYRARILPETEHVTATCCVCGELKCLSYLLQAEAELLLCECYQVKAQKSIF